MSRRAGAFDGSAPLSAKRGPGSAPCSAASAPASGVVDGLANPDLHPVRLGDEGEGCLLGSLVGRSLAFSEVCAVMARTHRLLWCHGWLRASGLVTVARCSPVARKRVRELRRPSLAIWPATSIPTTSLVRADVKRRGTRGGQSTVAQWLPRAWRRGGRGGAQRGPGAWQRAPSGRRLPSLPPARWVFRHRVQPGRRCPGDQRLFLQSLS